MFSSSYPISAELLHNVIPKNYRSYIITGTFPALSSAYFSVVSAEGLFSAIMLIYIFSFGSVPDDL